MKSDVEKKAAADRKAALEKKAAANKTSTKSQKTSPLMTGENKRDQKTELLTVSVSVDTGKIALIVPVITSTLGR